jgi:hypothetical protein
MRPHARRLRPKAAQAQGDDASTLLVDLHEADRTASWICLALADPLGSCACTCAHPQTNWTRSFQTAPEARPSTAPGLWANACVRTLSSRCNIDTAWVSRAEEWSCALYTCSRTPWHRLSNQIARINSPAQCKTWALPTRNIPPARITRNPIRLQAFTMRRSADPQILQHQPVTAS